MNNKITYLTSFEDINQYILTDFFVGWSNKPKMETLQQILVASKYKVIAIDTTKNKIVGFIYATTDNYLSAYIPLLEVLPEYQKKGIGTKLLEILLEQLAEFYMIDLSCDSSLIEYYKTKGFQQSNAMIIRNYNKIN
ncbi:MAG: GNAT family N-acetyltransferase [Chitinophagales bacterium]|nr:GNAT family N-acetyltransferase [Chitinophagales bacterium]